MANNNKANELKLRKFVTPLKEDNEALKELNKKFYENIELSDELSPGTKFLKEFPDGYKFLDDYIHIIVQPPATTGKRKTEGLDEENGNPKREKLQQKDEKLVQNLIKKLPDTNDKVFTVPVLPGDDTDTVIYNRSCYGYLRDFILNDTSLNRYCITGNPGIGKSYFGRVMMVELLKQKKSVLIDYEGFTAWIEPDGSILKIKAEDHETFRQVAGEKDVVHN